MLNYRIIKKFYVSSRLNSLNPLGQSNYLIDISRDLTAINTVLLTSLVATTAAGSYGYS